MPKGCVLRPILFLAFINNMAEHVNAKMWKHHIEKWNPILTVINSSKTSIAYMNGKHFRGWLSPPHLPSATWCMSPEKVNPYSESIPSKAKLWVLLTQTCRAINRTHMEQQSVKSWSKANRTLGFIRRTVTTSYSDAKVEAYNTLIDHRWNMLPASQTPSRSYWSTSWRECSTVLPAGSQNIREWIV